MAVKPRLSVGVVDLGDVRSSVETVVEENVDLYDRTFKTIVDNFTQPLTAEEMRQIVQNLSAAALAGIVVEDPELARNLLAAARKGMENA